MSTVTDLTVDVVKLCRELRFATSTTRLLPEGVEVAGIGQDQQRALVQAIATGYPQYSTVRDGATVKVRLR